MPIMLSPFLHVLHGERAPVVSVLVLDGDGPGAPPAAAAAAGSAVQLAVELGLVVAVHEAHAPPVTGVRHDPTYSGDISSSSFFIIIEAFSG